MPAWIVLLRGASAACGFAAFGLALYAHSTAAAVATGLFAGFGFVAGLVLAGLHGVFDVKAAAQPAALPPQALAALVRATLASTTAARQARPGSAADRRPSPAVLASSALAGAAASASASASVLTPALAAVVAPGGVALPAGAVAPAVPGVATTARRFASSEFGA